VLTCILSTGHLQVAGCVRIPTIFPDTAITRKRARLTFGSYSVQVNIPAETGDMGVLASHVPSIEQLRPSVRLTSYTPDDKHKTVADDWKDFGYKNTADTWNNSLWWFRYRPARLQAQHQRC
jgi:hypothetical protein